MKMVYPALPLFILDINIALGSFEQGISAPSERLPDLFTRYPVDTFDAAILAGVNAHISFILSRSRCRAAEPAPASGFHRSSGTLARSVFLFQFCLRRFFNIMLEKFPLYGFKARANAF